MLSVNINSDSEDFLGLELSLSDEIKVQISDELIFAYLRKLYDFDSDYFLLMATAFLKGVVFNGEAYAQTER